VIRSLWTGARRRAQKRGLSFSITRADIRQVWPADDRCPALGIELRVGRGLAATHSPTLDRMNNAWGYEAGNIAVISHRANKLKSNATAAELESLAAWMRSHGLS
jgi:hypothetical protein